MFLTLADAAVARQCRQQGVVRAPVEGRQVQPLLDVGKGLGRRQARGELRQQCRVSGAQLAPLRCEPGTEGRGVVQLQALAKVTVNLSDQRFLALDRERFDAGADGLPQVERVHRAVAKVKADRVTLCHHALATGLVHRRAQAAQAPAQFAARIGRCVPEQLAQRATAHRPRRQREVGQQGAQLARRRQGYRLTVTPQGDGTQHLQLQAGSGGGGGGRILVRAARGATARPTTAPTPVPTLHP